MLVSKHTSLFWSCPYSADIKPYTAFVWTYTRFTNIHITYMIISTNNCSHIHAHQQLLGSSSCIYIYTYIHEFDPLSMGEKLCQLIHAQTLSVRKVTVKPAFQVQNTVCKNVRRHISASPPEHPCDIWTSIYTNMALVTSKIGYWYYALCVGIYPTGVQAWWPAASWILYVHTLYVKKKNQDTL